MGGSEIGLQEGVSEQEGLAKRSLMAKNQLGSRRERDLPWEMSLRHPVAALPSWGSQSVPIYSPIPRLPARAVVHASPELWVRAVSEFPITDLASTEIETALEAPVGPQRPSCRRGKRTETFVRLGSGR